MNDKNIEEKAKEYANDLLPHANDIDAGYEQALYWKYAKFGYKDGYTQAVIDQSDTLTQYKEALEAAKTALNIIANSDPISIGLDEVSDMANSGLTAINDILNNE